MEEDSPALFHEAVGGGQQEASTPLCAPIIQAADATTSDGMELLAALGEEERDRLFFRFMALQSAGTVVTFVPLPALPDGGGGGERRAAWVERVRAMTADYGPTIFVQAVDDVISVEL